MAYKDPELRRAYNARRRERRQSDPEYRERANAVVRDWYQRNRVAVQEQRARDRPWASGKSRERSARYYQDNRAELDKKNREYQQRNREKFRAYKREYYLRNREEALASHTRNRHGLWPEDWAAIWTAQEGRCYLCGEPMIPNGKTGAHVDHDHSHCLPNRSCRICQRGLACMDCNVALGHTRDDPARLRRMADALEAAQVLVNQRKTEEGERLTLF